MEDYKSYFVTLSYQPEQDGGLYGRLCKLNSQNKNGHEVLGRFSIPNACKSISTGNYSGSMGLMAGGMDDGTVMIWDIATIYNEGDTVANQTESTALLSAQIVHEGSGVNAVEFNPNIQNLLASGGSEVLIQDIQEDIAEPNVFVPGEPNFHEGAIITAISWNKTVPYILASAANNGSVVVWDLKNSKAIFNFKDPNLTSYAYDFFAENNQEQVTANYNIIWSLEVPTQFMISSDNDNAPMTMYDLRKPSTPIITISDVHTGGVLATSWCPHDHKIIASSSNEGKTCFFHAESGDLLSNIQDGKCYLRMEWSPYSRGLLLGYSKDNETNIIDFSSTTSKAEAADSHYAPKWLSRPLGARFGFGGKLVTFTDKPGQPLQLYQTEATPEIGKKLQDLEDSKDKNEITEIIDTFIDQSNNEIERMEWVTIRSLGTKNFDSLFALLDIDKEKVFAEAERFSGKKKAKKDKKPDHKPTKDNLSSLDATQASDFFATLAENSDKRMEEEEKTKGEVRTSEIKETVSRNSNWDEGAEGIIKRNLLIGNIEGAAECALKCGRSTEALLLAICSDNDNILEQIKDEYFSLHKDDFVSTVIRSIVDGKIKELVMNLTQSNWKEALAYTLSFTQKAQIPVLVEEIAENLLNKKRDVNSAIICYMISKNIKKVAELWKIRADTIASKNPKHRYAVYSNYAEKITFYRIVTGINEPTEHCDFIIGELAEYLATEGHLVLSHKYLDANNSRSSKCMKIREQIFYSNEEKLRNQFERPKYQHKVHQLPKIVPTRNTHATSSHPGQNPIARNQPRGGFSKPVGLPNPNIFQPNDSHVQPPANKPVPIPNVIKPSKNKNSNFGYSDTDPLLMSATEESKVDENTQRRANPARRQKHAPPTGLTGANVFDPSKATNLPPPPSKTPGKVPPRAMDMNAPPMGGMSHDQNQNYTPAAPTFDQYSPSNAGFGQTHFDQPPVQQQPVIAVGNVKPPTAQKTSQAKVAVQRYAPPPRLTGNDSANTGPQIAPPNVNRPTPPGRGMNAPRPVGARGAPPMGRGGAPTGMARAPAPAPAPYAGGQQMHGHPGGQQMPPPPAQMSQAQTPMVPPPPMVNRRARPPGMQ